MCAGKLRLFPLLVAGFGNGLSVGRFWGLARIGQVKPLSCACSARCPAWAPQLA